AIVARAWADTEAASDRFAGLRRIGIDDPKDSRPRIRRKDGTTPACWFLLEQPGFAGKDRAVSSGFGKRAPPDVGEPAGNRMRGFFQHGELGEEP
ncbi:hypothetical protein AB0I53_38205, partial [Saccharopolyspora sp. NPDC050389]|uniref:hypothetical protein n=1 Tax=Saccharopolyspora sp. NPDC050389 TaxID=3155516 RepID=UPI0033F99DDF